MLKQRPQLGAWALWSEWRNRPARLVSLFYLEVGVERILLIHPDGVLRDRLTFLLQHLGFRVATAAEGQQGLAEIEGNCPDLIVMAESSHRLNGDEPCIRVREISDAPIVILGQGEEEVAGVEFLEMGADVYLTSPLDARELLAYVHSLLRRRQMQQSVKGDSKEQ